MANIVVRGTGRFIKWLSFTPTVNKGWVIARYTAVLSLILLLSAAIIELLNTDCSVLIISGFLAAALLSHIIFKNELIKTTKAVKTTDEIDNLFARNTAIALGLSAAMGLGATLIAAVLQDSPFGHGIITFVVTNFLLNFILNYLSIPKNLRPALLDRDPQDSGDYETSTNHYTDFADVSNTLGLYNSASPNDHRYYD